MTNAAQHFASDNNAGACPEVMEAIRQADGAGHVPSYGDDDWTARACDKIREVFETDCEVFFVFNGSAANGLSAAAMCRPYHALICHEGAHLATDECNGPEFLTGGARMLAGSGENGRLTPETIERLATARSDLHAAKVHALSLTQSTEVGTIYSLEQIKAATAVARKHGLRVHMDGARFTNGLVALETTPAEMTWRSGIEVLSFGGTKNGLPVGEAVVFFAKDLAEDFEYRAKQAGQLASKTRFISAGWLGLLEGDVWLKNARHSNAMAARLAEHLSAIPAIEIAFPTEVNAVFARIPPEAVKAAHTIGWRFYTLEGNVSRLMCAFDTTPETVDLFAADLAEACRAVA